jgi:hypothetical protein
VRLSLPKTENENDDEDENDWGGQGTGWKAYIALTPDKSAV